MKTLKIVETVALETSQIFLEHFSVQLRAVHTSRGSFSVEFTNKGTFQSMESSCLYWFTSKATFPLFCHINFNMNAIYLFLSVLLTLSEGYNISGCKLTARMQIFVYILGKNIPHTN